MNKHFTRSKPALTALVILASLMLAAPVAAQDTHQEDTHADGEQMPFHLSSEIATILLGFLAIGASIATANKYGGDIGRSLYVVGGGISVFAVQRIWHSAAELGLLGGEPSFAITTYLFLLASILMAGGFVMAYRAI